MKGHKNGKKIFRLTRPDVTMATDATECANMLNNYLLNKHWNQYCCKAPIALSKVRVKKISALILVQV